VGSTAAIGGDGRAALESVQTVDGDGEFVREPFETPFERAYSMRGFSDDLKVLRMSSDVSSGGHRRRRESELSLIQSEVKLPASAAPTADAAQLHRPLDDLLDPLDDVLDERTRKLIHGRRSGKTHRRGWIVRRALAAADVVGLVLAFVLAEMGFGGGEGAVSGVNVWVGFGGFLLTIPLWLVLARLLGLYATDEGHADHTTVDDVARVFLLVTVGAWLPLVAWVTLSADLYMPRLVTFWASALVLVSLSRAIARSCVRRSDAYQQNTVIVGAGDVAQLIASKLLRHREYGINLLGFLDKTPRSRRDDLDNLTVLGGIERLPQIVNELEVDRVIVAFAGQDQGNLLENLRALRSNEVQIDVVPRFFDMVGPGADLHAIEGFPLVALSRLQLPWSALILKRALDVAGSACGLLVLLPLFAYVAIRIKLDSPGPVFYRHERVGLGGRRIGVFKFRTMRAEFSRGERYGGESAEQAFAELMADPERRREFELGHKLHDDPRVTPFGAFLRRTSIDEFPQLMNVLTGDLSLVGPRPITEAEIERYGVASEELLNVKPGITGYWQINGRSDVDYADRVRLDLAYVSDWSLGLDLTILAKTLHALTGGRGAY
jgi:exopolysaccharide biosynthesis polyprenyl glycosylphosphotransferase